MLFLIFVLIVMWFIFIKVPLLTAEYLMLCDNSEQIVPMLIAVLAVFAVFFFHQSMRKMEVEMPRSLSEADKQDLSLGASMTLLYVFASWAFLLSLIFFLQN